MDPNKTPGSAIIDERQTERLIDLGERALFLLKKISWQLSDSPAAVREMPDRTYDEILQLLDEANL